MAKAASWRGASAGALLALAGVVAVTGCVGNIGSDPSGTGPGREQPGPPRPGALVPAVRPAAPGRRARRAPAAPVARRERAAPHVDRHGRHGSTVQCNAIAPGRSPLRRLTTYEYNNTIRDLLGDTTNPGSALPAQVDSKQNPFGNDADEQSPTDVLVEKYQTVAEAIAARATANATALAKLHSCAATVTAANEEACARMIATSLAPRALPARGRDDAEIDELVTLYKNVRALSTTHDVRVGRGGDDRRRCCRRRSSSIASSSARPVAGNPAVKRVAGREMATRLSYMFWQTMPDAALFQAADAGMLDTKEGVLAAGPEAARRSEVASDGGVLLRQPAADSGPVRSHP